IYLCLPDLLTRILCRADQRLSATDILLHPFLSTEKPDEKSDKEKAVVVSASDPAFAVQFGPSGQRSSRAAPTTTVAMPLSRLSERASMRDMQARVEKLTKENLLFQQEHQKQLAELQAELEKKKIECGVCFERKPECRS